MQVKSDFIVSFSDTSAGSAQVGGKGASPARGLLRRILKEEQMMLEAFGRSHAWRSVCCDSQ